MTDISLDQALPVVRNLAVRKANAFARRCRFAIDEREDVQSQLLLSFLAGWPKYDVERASVQTFASRVMDREIASIVRYRMAGRRRHIEFTAPNRRDHSEFGTEGEVRQSDTPASPDEQQHFWIDIERLLLPLSPVLLETAYALAWYTPSELSVILGRSRTIIYQRIRRLREALVEAGIGADYFTAGARAQAPSTRFISRKSASHVSCPTPVRANTDLFPTRVTSVQRQRLACHAPPNPQPPAVPKEVRI